MDLELNGKVAIVTGGSRGIGKAIAMALANEGADVAIVARAAAALEAAASEIRKASGRRVLPISADTGSDQSVRDMVQRVGGELGGPDILVNCAATPGGQAAPPKLAEITADAFFEDMNVKVLGYLRCAREAAPHMMARGWGRIICVSGLAARQTGSTIGSMRNVALVAMAKNLADELGPQGVNVTVVHPSMTVTEKTAALTVARAQREGISEAEAHRRQFAGNSLQRAITAADIASVVTFLASPKAVAITGDVIAAGGGGRGIYY